MTLTPEQEELYLKVWVDGCHVTDSWATPPWWPEALETRHVINTPGLLDRVWGDPEAERTDFEHRARDYWNDMSDEAFAALSDDFDTVFLHRDPSDMSQKDFNHERECMSIWVFGRHVYLATNPDVAEAEIPWDPPWRAYQWSTEPKFLVSTAGCDGWTHVIVELDRSELETMKRVSAAINLRADGCRPFLHVKPIEEASKSEIEEATEVRDE
jgi:hypothetical protein